jgi:hypothetical protein
MRNEVIVAYSYIRCRYLPRWAENKHDSARQGGICSVLGENRIGDDLTNKSQRNVTFDPAFPVLLHRNALGYVW